MCHCPGILKLVEYFVDFTSVLYKLTSPLMYIELWVYYRESGGFGA